jgi:hypothetical protein
MIQKHLICPQRMRRIPSQFSWVDHRLVRDRHIESCSHPAAALYLFLITVADHQGLSYYSDPSLMTRLCMDLPTLDSARQNLIQIGLIAYESPLYQVLSLEPFLPTDRAPRVVPSKGAMEQPVHLGHILKRIMGENS